MAKYGKMDLDTIEAVLNLVGGYEGVEALKRGDLKVVPREREHVLDRDIFHLSVTSDGTKCSEWKARLKVNNQAIVWTDAELILQKGPDSFPVTSGKTSHLVILKNDPLFDVFERKPSVALRIAKQCGWILPDAEVACLLCELFSKGGLISKGLSNIKVMHDPIDSLRFGFGLEPRTFPGLIFGAASVETDDWAMNSRTGFVFALPERIPEEAW